MLRFAVDQIAIESAYRPAGAPPYVDHTCALTPEAGLRSYLEQKLQAAGGPGRLQGGDHRRLGRGGGARDAGAACAAC